MPMASSAIAATGGRPIARGSPADLMHAPLLEAIYGLPMGTLPHPVTGIPISCVR